MNPTRDQLIACALWNLRESDVSLDMSAQKKASVDDKEYYLRRHRRLKDQGADLMAQAAMMGS